MRSIFTKRHAIIGTGLIVFALSGLRAAPAYAACTPNAGPFCVDGIITDADNSGAGTGATKVTDPNGSTKELGPINSSATKIGVINTAPTPMLGLTNPNAQVDLNTVYTQTAIDPLTHHIWYYFAWARDTNNGSGFISIELEKSKVSGACSGTNGYNNPACNPWSGRQNGDFIILWDQQGNSTQISLRFFNSAIPGFGAKVDLDNTTSRATYSSDFTRGEAAIDFTATIFASGECLSFANTVPSTVTGNSDTADYKDTVLSAFPSVSNCGAVTVTKVTDPTGGTGSFPYTLFRTGVSEAIFDGAVDSDCNNNGSTTQCDATLTFDGDQDSIDNLLAGTDYKVTEGSVGPTYEEVSVDCVLDHVTYHLFGTGAVAGFPVEATKTTACTIVNKNVIGQLRIIKTVVPGFGLTAVPGAFNYTLDGGQAQPFANNGTTCVSGQECKLLTFQIGTHHDVVEPNPPANWSVSYSNCANVEILASTVQTCTVTNTATQATPSVLTRQRVVLFDRAVVSGLRRSTGEPAATVTFKLYATLDACNAQGASLGSETVIVTFPNTTDTSVSVPTTQVGFEINPSGAGDTGSVPYFWRAVYQQSGANPPNANFLTDCTEITTVKIQQ